MSVRLTRAENKETQLSLQMELAEENHNHFSHRSAAVGTTNVCHEIEKLLLRML